jgi:Fe-S cluster assembly iron-binding protein IscA
MSEKKQDTLPAVDLTAEAAEKARQFMAEENLLPESAGLRVSVLPGGCSGFQY